MNLFFLVNKYTSYVKVDPRHFSEDLLHLPVRICRSVTTVLTFHVVSTNELTPHSLIYRFAKNFQPSFLYFQRYLTKARVEFVQAVTSPWIRHR
jgi:hypothetical protein